MGQLLDSLCRYFEETPKEVLDRDWEEMKYLNEIGPDVVWYAEQTLGHRSYIELSTIDPCRFGLESSYISGDGFYCLAA